MSGFVSLQTPPARPQGPATCIVRAAASSRAAYAPPVDRPCGGKSQPQPRGKLAAHSTPGSTIRARRFRVESTASAASTFFGADLYFVVAGAAARLAQLQRAGGAGNAGFNCVARRKDGGDREMEAALKASRERSRKEAEQRVVPSDAVVKAVESLGLKVTDGDVASTAGRELAAVRQELMALAYNAGGHMQVAETGDIVYEFPSNFRSVLSSNDRRFRALELWRSVSGTLYKAGRISFGVALIVSIVLVFTALAAVSMSASSSSERDEKGERRTRSSVNFSFGPNLFDWYYWNRMMNPGWGSYGYSYTIMDEESRREYERMRRARLSFPEAIFSFVFGDGDPNAGLAERQWQLIGQVIRENGGAVTGEQILPYLDWREFPTLDRRASFFKYEDYMLPVLLRFQGRPEVGEQGDLVYLFPDLVVSTEAADGADIALPLFLREEEEKFSRADGLQKVMAGGLGALNVAGVAALGPALASYVGPKAAGGAIALAASGLWLLRLYALAFLAVPVARALRIRSRNPAIQRRNEERAAAAQQLEDPSADVRRKLRLAREKAREVAAEGRRGVDRRVIFSTDRSALEQELEGSKEDVDAEWTRRIERDRRRKRE